MKVTAKCTNHSGCLRAYRGEVIELDSGAPQVCPECGKPLTPAGGGSAGAIKFAAIGVGVIVVALGAFFALKTLKKGDGGESTPPAPEMTSPSDSNTAGNTTTPPDSPNTGTNTTSTNNTTNPPPSNEPPPAPPTATNEAGDEAVKKEVLARIDKMPGLPPEKRDRLYNSVQRAREMRKVVEIPFGSGQSEMPAAAQPVVKNLLQEPAIMKFRDDLTAVFVVLGFADTKGNEQQNLRISDTRAKSVVNFMEKQCGIKNVTHAVAMGGTTLVNKDNASKNRVAEIWAVLP